MTYEITRIKKDFLTGQKIEDRHRVCYVDNLDQAKEVLAAFLEKNEEDVEVELNTLYPYRYNPYLVYIVEEFE